MFAIIACFAVNAFVLAVVTVVLDATVLRVVVAVTPIKFVSVLAVGFVAIAADVTRVAAAAAVDISCAVLVASIVAKVAVLCAGEAIGFVPVNINACGIGFCFCGCCNHCG